MDDWDDDQERDRGDPLDDFAALWAAENPEALWQALTLLCGNWSAHPLEAVGLFRRHHRSGKPGAATTALLLCTAPRWGGFTARLIAGLVDTAILTDGDLDELAATFLWSDRFRFEYPANWRGLEWVNIDLDGLEGPISIPLGRVDPDSRVPTERSIAPPLRRWAAARVLRTDPRTVDKMRARAAELGPIDGGAIVAGLLDAIEVLDGNVARTAIELGLAWPRASVRLVALDLLAAIDLEAARRGASADPDRKVRARSPERLGRRGGSRSNSGEGGAQGPLGKQTELFPE